MSGDEYPPRCPKCGSSSVERESISEYTGGGYADRWDEFVCNDCRYEWRSEEKTSYY
ncbi:MAG: hypothetical protein ACFFEF_06260 [Candidatus Thorarchaeota archaeon]